MTAKNLNKNYECNFIDSDIIPLDTRIKSEYDKAETFPLSPSDSDTDTLSPLDNNTSSLSSSGERSISPFLSFPCLTRESRSHECRIESGRSMVEMLGVLAVIGVLSIGGIMGYSYGMDKYRANETTNQIMLRAIGLMTQSGQNRTELSLAEWENEPAQYDFSNPIYTTDDLIKLDVGTASNPIPKRVCEQIFEGMKSNALYIDINGQEMDVDAECDTNNTMTFYFEGGNSQMDVCNPACGENEYCDNGICFKGELPVGTGMILDKTCSSNEDCQDAHGNSCSYCSNWQGQCVASPHRGSCLLATGEYGLCYFGECVATNCSSNDDCTHPSTYCSIPNTNCSTPFPDNEKGVCIQLNYKDHIINGKTYSISQTSVSYWDAQAMCEKLGKTIDDILGSTYYIWAGESESDTCYAYRLASYERGTVYKTVSDSGYFAVCQ